MMNDKIRIFFYQLITPGMGIEVELVALLIIQLLGSAFFSRFEGETPAINNILKWVVLDGITVGLFYVTGHYALPFPVVLICIGAPVHISWCKKYGIDPVKVTSRKKYYELRKRKWEECCFLAVVCCSLSRYVTPKNW